MDANNENEMFSSEAQEYWQNVDLYIGGSEHATGHLLYSRFWVKLLHDLGKVTVNEPFQKMINQGMILGESAFAYRLNPYYQLRNEIHGISMQNPTFVSLDVFSKSCESKEGPDSLLYTDVDYLLQDYIVKNAVSDIPEEPSFSLSKIRVDVSIVHNDKMNTDDFRSHNNHQEYVNSVFLEFQNGKLFNSPNTTDWKVSREVEKCLSPNTTSLIQTISAINMEQIRCVCMKCF